MLLFLLLIAVPIIEIALFIEIGGWIGSWPTIGVVVLTAAVGTVLLRAQGLAALGEVQRTLNIGGNPAPALAHGALILVAGVLLLTPGFFTDGVGFLLLVPAVRAAVIRHLRRRMTVVHMHAAARRPDRTGPQTVDGEYEEAVPEHDPARPASNRGASGGSGWTRVPNGHTGE
jgi:UPF0716 protein FxsA